MKTRIFSFLILILLAFSISAQTKEAQKIDEFGSITCDDYLARIDNAITQAHNSPNSIVYVFVYEGKESRYNDRKKTYESILPTFGSAKAKISSMKKYISGVRRFPADNFQFTEAGFREGSGIEIWLVPPGATPPKPTPTLTKMRFRKGKPVGFCLYCCD